MDNDDTKKPHVYQRYKRKWYKNGEIAVMIGKKGTGKTTLLLDLCHAIRHTSEVTLFQKTLATNTAFWDVVPAMFSYDTWRPEKMRKIIERNKRINKKRQKEGRPKHYHTVIIDDLAGDDTFTKDKVLPDLFFNARHYCINVIFTMQYSLRISPDLRSMIDWIFMFREIMPGNRKRLYDHYCGQFGSPQAFNKVFNKMTENRGVMVLRNTGLSNDIEKNYFFYTATMRNFNEDKTLPRWKMGSKAWWAFHYRYYNKHWDSTDDESEQIRDKEIMMVK